MVARIIHLVGRFFDVLFARPLQPEELAAVRHWLGPELIRFFLEQPDADQRHGYQAGVAVAESGVTDSGVIVAALLHDIGKRHAGFGVIGRSLATATALMRLPRTRRMGLYLDHGEAGAAELHAVGAPVIAVEFARHHHGPRPDSVPPETWKLLQAADQPGRRESRPSRG